MFRTDHLKILPKTDILQTLKTPPEQLVLMLKPG